MSMFADYVHELTGDAVLEHEHGFIWYAILGDQCYAKEVYVKPAYRKTGVVRELEAELIRIAREYRCTHVAGSVRPSNANSTESLKFLLHMGYKLVAASDNFIAFRKDI